jgi:hypothetical protein
VATLAGRHFLKALLIVPAQLVEQLGCSVFQLGMILILPGTGSSVDGFELAQPHKLFFSGLGEEFAAASFAHNGVNANHHMLRNDNVSAFIVHASTFARISKTHI